MTMEEYAKTQLVSRGKSSKKRGLLVMVSILCLSAIIFSISTILKWYRDNAKIQQIDKEIDKNLDIEMSEEEGELYNPPHNQKSDYYYYVTFPFYEVNFSTLLAKNKDTIGFIHVPNTNIHYPVVQTKDNSYYLTHDFYQTENNAGWIFMDYRSDIDSIGDNTVIYGHARLDESMFGSLKKVLTTSWQSNRDNYVIFFSTLKENLLFQIFSIYTIKSENYYITPYFRDSEEKRVWILTMQKRNVAPISTTVDVNDKVLTLSTCQNNRGGRIVVHAKLIKREKRKN